MYILLYNIIYFFLLIRTSIKFFLLTESILINFFLLKKADVRKIPINFTKRKIKEHIGFEYEFGNFIPFVFHIVQRKQ